MEFLRAGVERLLLMLLGVTRVMFILQGVAFAGAAVAVFAAAPPDAAPWIRSAIVSASLLSGTFFVAGLLLIAARRWHVRHTSGGLEPAWPWPLLLGVSLLALPAVAAIAASGLPALWSQIAVQLAATGFWDAAAQGGQNSGLVLLPILVAVLVPALLTVAAFVSIVFPLALVPLLATRSPLFPTLLAMGTICQAALVLTGWIAADAFARLAGQALAAMAASGDAEVLRVAEELDRATGILTRTSTALAAPMFGMLAWLAFLRPSGAAAAFFMNGTGPTPAEALHAAPATPAASRPWVAIAPGAERPAAATWDAEKPPEPGTGARRARTALAVLGTLMIVFSAADRLRTRASYVSSQPAPGATLPDPPATVRVRFSAELDPASSLSLTQLVVQPSTGEGPRDVEVARRLAPDDPERRTIEAVPARLPAGLYRVTWQALPAGGGIPRRGSFSFGVGTPVPADTSGMPHSLQDGDTGARGRRQTLIGGILLLVFGALLPLLSSRG